MASPNNPTAPYGQCKCCLKTTYLKNMWEPQEHNGQWEVYGQMLVDCFGIDWTIILTVEEDNICQVCISKLRVATAFKQQVEQNQAAKEDPVGVVEAIEEAVSTERVQVEAIPSLDGKEVEVNFVPTSPKILVKPSMPLTEPPSKTEENSITVPQKNKIETAQVINTRSIKQNATNSKNYNLSTFLRTENTAMSSPLKQVINTPLMKQNTTTVTNKNTSTLLKKTNAAIHLKETTPLNKKEQASHAKKAEVIPVKKKMLNEEKTTAILAKENTPRPVKKDSRTIAKPENISLNKEISSKIEMMTTVNIQSVSDIDDDDDDEHMKEIKSDDNVFQDMEYLEEIEEDYLKSNNDEIFEDTEYLEENYAEKYEMNDGENESEKYDVNESEEYDKSDDEHESDNYEINDGDRDDDDEEFEPEPKKSKPTNKSKPTYKSRPTNKSTSKATNDRLVIRRAKRKVYTREDLKQALEAVKTGKMSRREASRVFNVPRCKITEEDVQNFREDEFTTQLLQATRAILAHTNATPFKVSGTGSFRCFYCGVKGPVFRHPDKLRQHTHCKHPDKVKQANAALRPRYLNQMVRFDIYNLKCECSMQISWENLYDHLQKIHGLTNIEEAQENVVPYKLTVDSDVIPCAFPNCDFSGCFSIIDTHMNKHYPNYLCGECGRPCVSEWRLRCHTTQFHQKGKFACNQCPRVFFSISSRNAHQESMHGTRFKCKICPQKFRTQKETNAHLKKEHADMLESVGKYCNLCGNYFWPKDFDRHLKLEHDGLKSNSSVKKFKCAVCSKMFFKKEAVLEHILNNHQE